MGAQNNNSEKVDSNNLQNGGNFPSGKLEANKSLLFPQIRGALSASTGYLITGTVHAWTGSALLQMQSDFHMGPTENSIVASIISIGSILGTVISASSMDTLGRRNSFLVSAPLLSLGWVLMGTATSIYTVYCGRFITGAATGFLLSASTIYISETCEAELRGRLGSLSPLNFSFGALLSLAVGGYLSWRTSCFVLTIPAIVNFVCMYSLPESPYWYLLVDKEERAYESLKFFRGEKYNIQGELKEMKTKLEDLGPTFSYKELFKPRTRLPLLIALFAQSLQQLTGSNIIMMYTSLIYVEANTSIDSKLGTVLSGTIQIIGTIISILCVDKFGRRFLISSSVILTGIFTTFLGVYFFVQKYNFTWPTWFPVFLVLSILFSYCLGLRSIPWLITSEVFNTAARSRASSICNSYNRIMHLLIIQLYPFIHNAVGNSYIFLFCGILSIANGICAIIIVPETKGKSLEEIQEYFERKSMDRLNKKTENTWL